MDFPGVSIERGDSVEVAADKVALACRSEGEDLYSLEPLNSMLPSSSFCRFFHTRLGGRDCVVVVMTRDWDEASVIRILNVLLEIRMEASSSGPAPLFRFCSVQPVPPVMDTLFGDARVAEFECRAAPVVRFGGELEAEMALRVAAVGMCLLREVFGLRADFWDDQGEDRIIEGLDRHLVAEGYSEEGAPLNTLVALGFFYGERQRARLGYPSSWVKLDALGPWPSVVFEAAQGGEVPPKRVAFSPIALVIGAYQEREAAVLRSAARELSEKCRTELGARPHSSPP